MRIRIMCLLPLLFVVAACNNSTEPETKIIEVVKRDTVTVEIVKHDTVLVISTPTPGEGLAGVWRAQYLGRYAGSKEDKGLQLTIALTPPLDFGDSLMFKAAFTAARMDGNSKTSIDGYVDSESGGLYRVSWGGRKCSWAFSFKDGKMYLQEIGDGFFLTASAIEFSR